MADGGMNESPNLGFILLIALQNKHRAILVTGVGGQWGLWDNGFNLGFICRLQHMFNWKMSVYPEK